MNQKKLSSLLPLSLSLFLFFSLHHIQASPYEISHLVQLRIATLLPASQFIFVFFIHLVLLITKKNTKSSSTPLTATSTSTKASRSYFAELPSSSSLSYSASPLTASITTKTITITTPHQYYCCFFFLLFFFSFLLHSLVSASQSLVASQLLPMASFSASHSLSLCADIQRYLYIDIYIDICIQIYIDILCIEVFKKINHCMYLQNSLEATFDFSAKHCLYLLPLPTKTLCTTQTHIHRTINPKRYRYIYELRTRRDSIRAE